MSAGAHAPMRTHTLQHLHTRIPWALLTHPHLGEPLVSVTDVTQME